MELNGDWRCTEMDGHGSWMDMMDTMMDIYACTYRGCVNFMPCNCGLEHSFVFPMATMAQ